MIDPVTGSFKVTQYNDKTPYQLQTQLKLRGYIYTPNQWKLRINKENNVLVVI